jgi:uncharacterized damage-inducible protein DinB
MTATAAVAAGSIAQKFLREFEEQAPITRRYLERVPEDKLTWKPHEKSLTLGQLAYHLAFVPGGVVRGTAMNPAPAPQFNFPQPASREEILKVYDESVHTVRELLPTFTDAAMHETWRIVADDREIVAMPRGKFLRDILLSHWYQHRGQLSVYLRIHGVPVPASWGPSADEPALFMQHS